MTATDETPRTEIRPRRTGFFQDTAAIARRSIRQLPRDIAFIGPTLFIPLFFLVINVASLSEAAEFVDLGISYEEFQLPVAIVFAVTGVTRAGAMVLDIQNGYFDRLMATPVSRRALLLGHMVADFVLVVALSVPVMILGFFMGVRFDTGPLGVLVFVLIGALWGLGYTGIPYAIALKTGNPGAVNSSFIIFFPFAFLTTAYLPADNLSGWLSTVSKFNPVTYVLGGLRSLFNGWDAGEVGKALLATLALAAFTQTLSLLALRGRTSPK
ncbi:MAG: ABC transporter permease [Actinomycetota bacterium]